MLLSLTRLKMAAVDVETFDSVSAIALTAVVGAVILLFVLLCNFVKRGFEKSGGDTQGTPVTFDTLAPHDYFALSLIAFLSIAIRKRLDRTSVPSRYAQILSVR